MLFGPIHIQSDQYKHDVELFGIQTDKRTLVNLHLTASFLLNVFSYIPPVFALNMTYKAALFLASVMPSGNEIHDNNRTSHFNIIRAGVIALDALCLMPFMVPNLDVAYTLFQAILSEFLYVQADEPIIKCSSVFCDESYTTMNFASKGV